MGYKLRNRQKLRTAQRAILIAGSASMLAVVAWMTFIMNHAEIKQTSASNRLNMSDPINNGEIVMGFTWETADALMPELGPVAVNASRNARCVAGGAENTFGLSVGNVLRALDMELGNFDGMNDEGADLSVDFRRMEASGNFFTRGNNFNFGMLEGKLVIHYKLRSVNGK